jgi:integration host factor subunit beta
VTTKKDIVKQISDRHGLTQLKTKDVVQDTFIAVIDTLLSEGRIELRNFGVFEIRRREARKARNPRTGESVDVPAKNVVTFKPGKEMEERVRKAPHLPGRRRTKRLREDRQEPVGAGVGAHDPNRRMRGARRPS